MKDSQNSSTSGAIDSKASLENLSRIECSLYADLIDINGAIGQYIAGRRDDLNEIKESVFKAISMAMTSGLEVKKIDTSSLNEDEKKQCHSLNESFCKSFSFLLEHLKLLGIEHQKESDNQFLQSGEGGVSTLLSHDYTKTNALHTPSDTSSWSLGALINPMVGSISAIIAAPIFYNLLSSYLIPISSTPTYFYAPLINAPLLPLVNALLFNAPLFNVSLYLIGLISLLGIANFVMPLSDLAYKAGEKFKGIMTQYNVIKAPAKVAVWSDSDELAMLSVAIAASALLYYIINIKEIVSYDIAEVPCTFIFDDSREISENDALYNFLLDITLNIN